MSRHSTSYALNANATEQAPHEARGVEKRNGAITIQHRRAYLCHSNILVRKRLFGRVLRLCIQERQVHGVQSWQPSCCESKYY